jgi:hypothetical protein
VPPIPSIDRGRKIGIAGQNGGWPLLCLRFFLPVQLAHDDRRRPFFFFLMALARDDQRRPQFILCGKTIPKELNALAKNLHGVVKASKSRYKKIWIVVVARGFRFVVAFGVRTSETIYSSFRFRVHDFTFHKHFCQSFFFTRTVE